ncbi:MAG: hypothetical protein U1F76_29350 [Candidatus Competibacteraceae bacterium]
MNINLHIERLLLEGVPISRTQGALVKAAVEAELGRLLAAGGLHAELLNGGALASLKGETLHLSGENHPARLGEQIARAVYGGIGPGKGEL